MATLLPVALSARLATGGGVGGVTPEFAVHWVPLERDRGARRMADVAGTFIVHIGGWIIVACILMSFIEHQVHRHLMHRRNFLSAHSASFKRVFEAHALVHHRHYAEIFSDEPVARGEDKEIRLTVRKAPMKALPVAALIALVSWPGAAVFVAVMTFHHWAWNQIHLEMHKPERKVFSTWPVYRFLARYHCLHHRHLDKNFNVVFPLADYVLGTHARANEHDLKYMERWGL